MRLKTKIALIETHIEMFYEHILSEEHAPIEVQWIGRAWQYRATPYAGEWIAIDGPLSVPNINFESLEFYLDHQLLTLYAARKLFGEEGIATKQIEVCFGKEVCEKAIEDAESFGKALQGLLIEHIGKRPHLLLVK